MSTLRSVLYAVSHKRAGVMLLADTGGAAGALSAYLDARHAAAAAQLQADLWGSTFSTAEPAEVLAHYEGGRWLEFTPLLESICALDELSGVGPLLSSYRIGGATGVGGAGVCAGVGAAGGEAGLPLDLAILRAMLQRHEQVAAEATAARAATAQSADGVGLGDSAALGGSAVLGGSATSASRRRAGFPTGRTGAGFPTGRTGAPLPRGQSKWLIEKPVRDCL